MKLKERWHDDVLQEVLRKRKLPTAQCFVASNFTIRTKLKILTKIQNLTSTSSSSYRYWGGFPSKMCPFWRYSFSNGNSLSDILTMIKNKVYVYEHLIRPLVLGISWFWYSSSTSGKSGEMQDSVSCQKNTFSSQQSVTKRGTRRQLIRINQKADNDPTILNNFTSRNNPSHPWQKI